MYNHSVEWTDPAWDDLDEISDYLVAQEGDFQLADELVTRMLRASEQLAAMPRLGKPGRVPDTREIRVQKTRYALVYAVSDTTVYILRVMHSSRLFPPESADPADIAQ